MTLAIYLMEIEKHGRSQIIHKFNVINRSDKPLNKKEHCFITRQLAVLCQLKLVTCAPTLLVCTDVRRVLTSAATSLLDFNYN